MRLCVEIAKYKTPAMQVVQRGLAIGLRRIDACGNGALCGRNDTLSGTHLWAIGIPELPFMDIMLTLGHKIIGGGPRRQVITMKIHHGFHFV